MPWVSNDPSAKPSARVRNSYLRFFERAPVDVAAMSFSKTWRVWFMRYRLIWLGAKVRLTGSARAVRLTWVDVRVGHQLPTRLAYLLCSRDGRDRVER